LVCAGDLCAQVIAVAHSLLRTERLTHGSASFCRGCQSRTSFCEVGGYRYVTVDAGCYRLHLSGAHGARLGKKAMIDISRDTSVVAITIFFFESIVVRRY
jgi:hypothetical protein